MRPKQLSLLWVPVFFSVVNQPGREVHYSPSSNAEDRNEWSCTPTPPICLHIVHSETLTLYTRAYLVLDGVNLPGAIVPTGTVVGK